MEESSRRVALLSVAVVVDSEEHAVAMALAAAMAVVTVVEATVVVLRVAMVVVANGGDGGGVGGDNSAISRTTGTNQLHSPDVGKSVRIIFPAGRGDMTPARQLNPTTQPYGALARCTTPAVCFTKWQSPPNPAASLCSVHTAPSPLLEDATSERRWMLVGDVFQRAIAPDAAELRHAEEAAEW